MHVLNYSIVSGPYDTYNIFKVTYSKVTVAKKNTFRKALFSGGMPTDGLPSQTI